MKTKLNLYFLCVLLLGFATCKVSFAQTTPAVSNPIISFAGKKSGESITLAELQNAKRIDCKVENVEGGCPIVSFSISIKINGTEFRENTSGSSLSDKQITLLSKAKKGNTIYIENIIVQKSGGVIATIDSINLKII